MNGLQAKIDRLNLDFDDPNDFIHLYNEVYFLQSKTESKVFKETIPYYTKFDITFLDYLFKFIMNNTENPAELESKMKEVEFTISEYKDKRFYDEEFYNLCGLVFVKALVFLVDQCEYILVGYDFKSEFPFHYFKLLYIFSDINLDLRVLFLAQLKNEFDSPSELSLKISTVKKIFTELNEQIKGFNFRSQFICDKRLISRLNVSEKLIGKEKVCFYDFDKFLDELVHEMIGNGEASNEKKYLRLINLVSEMELMGISDSDFYQKIRFIGEKLIN